MITLKDIANIIGVDKSTVSRALSGKAGVSKNLKEKILMVSKELGYIPNETAKVLAGKTAKTIGIILPEINCNYYASIVGNIEKNLRENGYSIIIGQSNFKYENEIHYLKLFIQKKVDGIIFNLYNTKEFINDLEFINKFLKTPIVFIEMVEKLKQFNRVKIDTDYGIELVIKHFAQNGHTKIGYISEFLSSKIRLPSFKKALKKYNIEYLDEFVKVGHERREEGGYLRMMEILKQKKIPQCIFASYDTMAIGALKALYEKGYKLPEDIELVGYDNIREAAFSYPPLTSVAPPVKELAESAVKIILEKIKDKSDKSISMILKPEIIFRETTKNRR